MVFVDIDMIVGPMIAVLALAMKVLTQRNGSSSLDLCGLTMMDPWAATSAPAAAKLASPLVTRCTVGCSANFAQAARVVPLRSSLNSLKDMPCWNWIWFWGIARAARVDSQSSVRPQQAQTMSLLAELQSESPKVKP